MALALCHMWRRCRDAGLYRWERPDVRLHGASAFCSSRPSTRFSRACGRPGLVYHAAFNEVVPQLALLKLQIDKVKEMFLADYHVHSTCSFDAKNRMAGDGHGSRSSAASPRSASRTTATSVCPETMQIGPDSFTLPKQQAHQYIEALEKAPEGIYHDPGP